MENNEKENNIYLESIDVFEKISKLTGEDNDISRKAQEKIEGLEQKLDDAIEKFRSDMRQKNQEINIEFARKYWKSQSCSIPYESCLSSGIVTINDVDIYLDKTLPNQSEFIENIQPYCNTSFVCEKFPEQGKQLENIDQEMENLKSAKIKKTKSFYVYVVLLIISLFLPIPSILLTVYLDNGYYLYLILFGVLASVVFLAFALDRYQKQKKQRDEKIMELEFKRELIIQADLHEVVEKMYAEYEEWLSKMYEESGIEIIRNEIDDVSVEEEKQLDASKAELMSMVRPSIAAIFEKVRELPLGYQDNFVFECRVSSVASEKDILDVYKGIKNDYEMDKVRQQIIDNTAKATEETIRLQQERNDEERRAHREQANILMEQAEENKRANEEQTEILRRQREDAQKAAEKQRKLLEDKMK